MDEVRYNKERNTSGGVEICLYMTTTELGAEYEFFNKVKAGVSEAGNKAKTVVEINRLKLQNNGKQNDIDQQYQVMGKLLFEAVTQGAGFTAK